MMAPVISFIAFSVAFFGPMPSSVIFACTASTTTIALSTTIPMAITRANKVIRLSEKPMVCMKKKVPINETGTAKTGMMVSLPFCKKMNTTKATRRNASSNVLITSLMEASKKADTS